MRYTVTSEFIKINETSGTIQNSSNIYTIEVSATNELNSGILLYPQQKHSFSDTEIYLRCVENNRIAEARVVPFELDAKGGGSDSGTLILNGEQYSLATNADITNLLNNIFGEEL